MAADNPESLPVRNRISGVGVELAKKWADLARAGREGYSRGARALRL